jgi:hypothetical protein
MNMARNESATRQRYKLATGQKLACGGPVKSAKAPAEPKFSYENYGRGVRKVKTGGRA